MQVVDALLEQLLVEPVLVCEVVEPRRRKCVKPELAAE